MQKIKKTVIKNIVVVSLIFIYTLWCIWKLQLFAYDCSMKSRGLSYQQEVISAHFPHEAYKLKVTLNGIYHSLLQIGLNAQILTFNLPPFFQI